MSFRSLHTQYGLARLAEAEASGVAINLTHIAVGDGNGNPTEPSDDQTQLVRERFRAPVNRVAPLPDDPTRFTAELVIPATEGGFVIRELGVFDDTGSLFLVGNLPDTYKPTADEGAYADTVIRVEFVASNAEVITLQVDPNVAVATQQWIINNVTIGTLLPGGTTGQIATKASNADGDIKWLDPDAQNVTVDTIEEKQHLVNGQVMVSLAVCTTRGLAVYVDGERVPNDEWAPHPTDPTQFSFNTAIVGAHELIAAQNEPTGNAPAPLERSKNLQDLDDKPTARDNLDVFSKAQSRQLAPAGLLGHFARSTAPQGWLAANGAAVNRIAYADLFGAIGTTFGAGDGFNTFNLPDLRGEFIRGWDGTRGADAGRAFGSWQNAAGGGLASVKLVRQRSRPSTGASSGNHPVPNDGSYSVLVHTGEYGGDTNGWLGFANDPNAANVRPRNRAMLACIKF